MANPTADQATITQRGALYREDNGNPAGWIYKNIVLAAPTTTLVKTGAGVLHSITFNKPTSGGVCELDDAITNTNAFATITTPAGNVPVTLTYDVGFTTGLSITTSTQAQDITVSYI